MQYGIKFDPAWAGGDDWREQFGDPDRAFSAARRWGLDFVELTWTEQTPPGAIAAMGRRVWQAGLGCSIHPYFYGELAADVFDRADPAGFDPLFDAAGTLADLTGGEVTVVFHPGRIDYEPNFRPADEAFAATRAFFRWAGRRAGEVPGVRVLCETNMPVFPPDDRDRQVLGMTYRECLDLTDGADVGICWDFGHAFASARLGHHPDMPPPAFVRRVGHVHAHDTVRTETGAVDHRPLGVGFCPWREYFRLLAGAGFDARVLFEIAMVNPGGQAGLGEIVGGSIAEIDAIFAAARP